MISAGSSAPKVLQKSIVQRTSAVSISMGASGNMFPMILLEKTTLGGMIACRITSVPLRVTVGAPYYIQSNASGAYNQNIYTPDVGSIDPALEDLIGLYLSSIAYNTSTGLFTGTLNFISIVL